MKKIYLSISIIVLLLIIGCSNPTITSDNKQTVPVVEEKSIDYKLAELIAENRINEMVYSKTTTWTKQSKIVKGYPVYTPGIKEAAYYEFKVMTDDKDAGYILVSVTQNDVEIPEISENGITLTEQYQQKTGLSEIEVVRYNWFESYAQKKIEGDKFTNPNVIAESRNYGIVKVEQQEQKEISKQYYEKNLSYALDVVNNKCVSMYEKEDLNKYYSQKEQQTSYLKSIVSNEITRGNPTPPPRIEEAKDSLRNSSGYISTYGQYILRVGISLI
ncbi:MAG: hypothetical protein A2086_13155 [Spirochaetes bacterium GWD1_27_9]|nr:MAG: hypothetical protein A2Z98_00990 [Spirochaetes bacterium GWB1_27_13]OHD44066.1 MAG: hypothetical protein A2086_13155 [Spirochaetes bacterium GWD1_27_9]